MHDFITVGFTKLVTTDICADLDYALPPTGNHIAVFATDLDSLSSGFGSCKWTRGFVDDATVYRLYQTDPAMRFWWNGVTLAGDVSCPFDVPIVLLDRSNDTNNSDFDIEFNYGEGGQVPPADIGCPSRRDGFRRIRHGPHSRGPFLGPFGSFDVRTDRGATCR